MQFCGHRGVGSMSDKGGGACENITFQQLRLQAVIKVLFALTFKHLPLLVLDTAGESDLFGYRFAEMYIFGAEKERLHDTKIANSYAKRRESG